MRYEIYVAKNLVRWYKDDLPHREYGTAWEYSSGRKFWCKDGQIHRLDGPACEYVNGYKYWYIDNKEYTEKEFKKEMKK